MTRKMKQQMKQNPQSLLALWRNILIEIWIFFCVIYLFIQVLFSLFGCVCVHILRSVIYDRTTFQGSTQWHCEKSPVCQLHTCLLSAIFLVTIRQREQLTFINLTFSKLKAFCMSVQVEGNCSHTMAEKLMDRILMKITERPLFSIRIVYPFSIHNGCINEYTRYHDPTLEYRN